MPHIPDLEPFAKDDGPAHRTTEDRRDEIVNKRVNRGLAGFLVAFAIGFSVLFAEHYAGMCLIVSTVAIMVASLYYIFKTLKRRRGRLKRKYMR